MHDLSILYITVTGISETVVLVAEILHGIRYAYSVFFQGGIIIISHEDLLQCKTLPSPPNGDWFCSNHFLLKSRCTATCSNGFLLFSEMVEHGSENQERIDVNSTEEWIEAASHCC